MIYLNCTAAQLSNIGGYVEPNAQGAASHNSSEQIAESCRKNFAALMGIRQPERIFFTARETTAINFVLSGLNVEDRHVVTTFAESGAVLQPLMNRLSPMLKNGKTRFSLLKCNTSGHINCFEALKTITPDTAAIFVNHCSNVTGAIQDINALCEIAHRNGALLIADASQSVGRIDLNVEKCGIDILIFSDLKGILDVQGISGLYIRPGIERFLCSGTEKQIISILKHQESTIPAQKLALIEAGLKSILRIGIDEIENKEHHLIEMMANGLEEVEGISIFRNRQERFGPILSFIIQGLSPTETTDILRNSYGITVDAGLHNEPLVHRALGTCPLGTVRAGVSFYNSYADVVGLLNALKDLSGRMSHVAQGLSAEQ
jgi:selenocysteine lyase/cysteine desulfurase